VVSKAKYFFIMTRFLGWIGSHLQGLGSVPIYVDNRS
jgi:hypothetical protein